MQFTDAVTPWLWILDVPLDLRDQMAGFRRGQRFNFDIIVDIQKPMRGEIFGLRIQ